MYSYLLLNEITNERVMICGYDLADACRRAKFEKSENWVCIDCNYED